ncbi:hypothetical protein MuYL_1644 [Mucilaginibacter xinganensis]|uniref:Glycosyltransferase 2-like domain-containing protein n=2 Tax=Mucilaginibacter xinganensis TaxID=1234841 RepID=A0A223NUI5_9SPHI|nr:hypothetical protein MuYL_1644 [Mucilaginibacter xinganensis]
MVKNESQVIRRALESALPHIDHWVICDTGSTDGTPQIIEECLTGINGKLHHTQWENFGHNRAEVIRLAEGKGDYILIMDADMILNVKAPFKETLALDFYEIRYEGSLDYTQPMLISNRHNWNYEGVTHEFIHAETASSWAFLPQVTLTHFGDGGSRLDKFERDIKLLTEALEAEPGNARYMFYLAQSYKDTGKWAEALHWYQKRMEAGSWAEERWYAMYQAAEMKRQLNLPWPEIMGAYQAAFDERPIRLEPVYAIAKHYRETSQFYQGYLYSAVALQGVQYPENEKLFIEKPVYTHLLLLEHITCALACGRVSEAIEGANLILRREELPADVYEHAINARSMAYNLLKGSGIQTSGQHNKIVVIVPFYNASVFLNNCVKSLQMQDYDCFRVIFIDDASTDENRGFACPQNLDSVIIRNTMQKGSLFNFNYAITEYCEPDDIVVCLDGDDLLTCPEALSYINDRYQQHDCWVMYGQYEACDGTKGISAPFASPKDFGTLRTIWRTSHIKTFRAGLFHCIAEQDPELACFKDKNGDWLNSAADAAIMFPLIEMAGFNRVLFNQKVLYSYNAANLLSHHHKDMVKQTENFDWVSSMRPFGRVKYYQPVNNLLLHS